MNMRNEKLDSGAMTAFIQNLLGDVDPESTRRWIDYATGLENDGVEHSEEFYKNLCGELEYIKERDGIEIALQLYNEVKNFAFNPFELRNAAELLKEGIPMQEIRRRSIEEDLFNAMERDSGSFPRHIGSCTDTDSNSKETEEKTMKSREWVKNIKETYPPGTRIRLTHMDDPQAVPDGMKGTVVGVDDAGQLLMKWDNRRTLFLLPDKDKFEVIQHGQEDTGWHIGDTCYIVMNRAKKLAYPFTIDHITEKGFYHVISPTNGMHHNAAPTRMFHTKEDAIASLTVQAEDNGPTMTMGGM